MNPEDQLLCLCARQEFTTDDKTKVQSLLQARQIDWGRVLETADLSQVSPLVYANLLDYSSEHNSIPADVLRLFKQRYMHNVIVKKRSTEILAQALRFLSGRKINAMLLKGAALDATVYRQPWYTCMADLDLILSCKREELSEQEGWQIDDWFREYNQQANAYKVHMEYDFYIHHDMTMNGLIDVDVEGTWQAARAIELHGQPVLVMSPEDLLIASAVNSCRKRYFRLKSACDVSAILEKYPHLDWQAVADKSIAYRCNFILYASLLVTHTMLETPIPHTIITDLRVPPVRSALIRFLCWFFLHTIPLERLARNKEGKILEREPGWGLVLTYATYRLDQVLPKLRRLVRVNTARRQVAH